MKEKIIKTNDEIVTNKKKTVGLGFTTAQGTTPKGITLIALVITIIIMLILASVAINLTLGENGIFNRAKYAKEKYKIAEIREKVELAILEIQMQEIELGNEVTIETIINQLIEKGYKIEQKQTGKIMVEEIEVNSSEITLKKGQNANILYTLKKITIGETRYFIDIQGEYYEILYDNNKVIVSEELTNINNIRPVEEEITVTSGDTNVVAVALDENEIGKINLKAGETEGQKTTITIKSEKVEVLIPVRIKWTRLEILASMKSDLSGNGFSLLDKSSNNEYYNFNALQAGGSTGKYSWHANFKWNPGNTLDDWRTIIVGFNIWAERDSTNNGCHSNGSGTVTIYYEDNTSSTATTGLQTTGNRGSAPTLTFTASLPIKSVPVSYVVFNVSGLNNDYTSSRACVSSITLSD